MALIVEDGTGKIDAESYLSVADLDAYVAKFGLTYSATTDPEKEADLRVATQYLDAVYGQRYLGIQKTETQALDFPRSGIIDVNGYLLDEDVLPVDLESSTAEAAVRARTENLIPDLASPGMIESEEYEVGPLRTAISYVGGKSQIKRYRKIDLLMASLVNPGNRLMRS